MQTYWVWFRDEFIGRVRSHSREAAKRAFGLDPSGLRVALEEELSLDEWVMADALMRA